MYFQGIEQYGVVFRLLSLVKVCTVTAVGASVWFHSGIPHVFLGYGVVYYCDVEGSSAKFSVALTQVDCSMHIG